MTYKMVKISFCVNTSGFSSLSQYLAPCRASCCKPKLAKSKTSPDVNSQMETGVYIHQVKPTFSFCF